MCSVVYSQQMGPPVLSRILKDLVIYSLSLTYWTAAERAPGVGIDPLPHWITSTTRYP